MYTIEKNCSLRDKNSFGVEASARRLIRFDGVADLPAIFSEMGKAERWMVLGGGNNILFTSDYDGTLLQPTDQSMAVCSEDEQSVRVRIGAGVEWDDFVAWCVAHGWGGVENLSLIPGKVGAAPVQNIGAYGAEAKDTIDRVECYFPEQDTTGMLTNAECRFGYRDSIFKRELKGRAVILSVEFLLSRRPQFKLRYGDVADRVESLGGVSLEHIRRAVIDIRQSKLPDPKELGNAGSFFKNPVVSQQKADALRADYPDMPCYPAGAGEVKLAAGWLIDRCGLRGKRWGAVGVHDRQALVLVNFGGATGRDVVDAAARVRAEVSCRFGVDIEMEVNIV